MLFSAPISAEKIFFNTLRHRAIEAGLIGAVEEQLLLLESANHRKSNKRIDAFEALHHLIKQTPPLSDLLPQFEGLFPFLLVKKKSRQQEQQVFILFSITYQHHAWAMALIAQLLDQRCDGFREVQLFWHLRTLLLQQSPEDARRLLQQVPRLTHKIQRFYKILQHAGPVILSYLTLSEKVALHKSSFILSKDLPFFAQDRSLAPQISCFKTLFEYGLSALFLDRINISLLSAQLFYRSSHSAGPAVYATMVRALKEHRVNVLFGHDQQKKPHLMFYLSTRHGSQALHLYQHDSGQHPGTKVYFHHNDSFYQCPINQLFQRTVRFLDYADHELSRCHFSAELLFNPQLPCDLFCIKENMATLLDIMHNLLREASTTENVPIFQAEIWTRFEELPWSIQSLLPDAEPRSVHKIAVFYAAGPKNKDEIPSPQLLPDRKISPSRAWRSTLKQPGRP